MITYSIEIMRGMCVDSLAKPCPLPLFSCQRGEMVDAGVLEASACNGRGGSSPLAGIALLVPANTGATSIVGY